MTMSRRYTLDGSDALESRIERDLGIIREAVLDLLPASQIDALVLGGSYGRGEGGVCKQGDDETPYNDYDLVLIHHCAAPRRSLSALADRCQALSRQLRMHVDVTPLQRTRIPHLPPALTWYELGLGHRLIYGTDTCLRPLAQRTLDDVDASEWGRLLLNRAAGIHFALLVQAGKSVQAAGHDAAPDFIARQIEKAWLALGDVWLAERNRYAMSVVSRQHAMRALADQPSWAERWHRAAAFKLHPHHNPTDPTVDLAIVPQLLASALTARSASLRRGLLDAMLGLRATLRSIPRTCWLRSNPFRLPRERLRLALIAAFNHDEQGYARLVGDARTCEALWSACG